MLFSCIKYRVLTEPCFVYIMIIFITQIGPFPSIIVRVGSLGTWLMVVRVQPSDRSRLIKGELVINGS